MKKFKMTLFALIIIAMSLFYNGLGCGRPLGLTINNNKEMAKLIPVLRGDAPLIIDKLEILRLGLSRGNEYTILLGGNGNDYQIEISDRYSLGYPFYNFSERLEEFSVEIIDAINYLLLSDELQMNASSIHFYLRDYPKPPDTPAPYAVFAREDQYVLGICYFDPDNTAGLEIFRRDGDYVEELWGNYWLVMWYRIRG
ncbi:MAG: hypothetical protein LBI28_00800 [Treponema sp.]|jgi:hypothetical protein|nr:hypothetical protein [Treponema sp.]